MKAQNYTTPLEKNRLKIKQYDDLKLTQIGPQRCDLQGIGTNRINRKIVQIESIY